MKFSEYIEQSHEDDNLFWRLSSGQHQRMLDEASQRVIELEAWINEALPMLETAACIVIEESRERLAEIAGVRAVIEMCPLDTEAQ
jgi:hypothetical protein